MATTLARRFRRVNPAASLKHDAVPVGIVGELAEVSAG